MEQALYQIAARLRRRLLLAANQIVDIQHGMGPAENSKPVGNLDGVNPYHIMLLNQLLQRRTIRLAHCIGIAYHVRRIKLVSQPLGKLTGGTAWRDEQRAYDPVNPEFTLGSADRFLIFLLGGNNHEGYVSKTAQQFPNIQHALLRTVGRRHGPVGGYK
jgi:hypothetical protein